MDHTPPRDPMQEFANRIVAELENGVKPWVRPWDPEKAGGPQAPFNPITGKRYHGINVLILGMDMRAFQSGDPRWMTYQQAHEKHWQVRKGEKSTTIFFAKPYEVEDDEAEDGRKMIRVLKHYAVFHASQIDGIPAYKAPGVEEAPWTRPEAADIILKNSGAIIRIGGDRAFYSPSTDHIQLPPEGAFRGPPEFAATALHELGHWTGQSCAKLVDNDEQRYTVAVLQRWKTISEAAALRALEWKADPGDDDELIFLRVEQLMPDLLNEIRSDLQERPLTREFVLLKKVWTYWPGGQEASYFYEDHPDLENKVRILQNYGLVREITFNDVKRYVLTEALARYLGA